MLAGLATACGGASSRAPGLSPPSSTVSAKAAPAPSGPRPVGLKAVGEATIGDKTTCPTSGEEFVVTSDSPKVDYKGKTYYFCCGGCDSKFTQDPEKYLKKKPDA